MWSNPAKYDVSKIFKYKCQEFFIQIFNQIRLSKTIRFQLSEPLKCIVHQMNIKPSQVILPH
jgi:hypothetical protein